jgi:hypothetical protein
VVRPERRSSGVQAKSRGLGDTSARAKLRFSGARRSCTTLRAGGGGGGGGSA